MTFASLPVQFDIFYESCNSSPKQIEVFSNLVAMECSHDKTNVFWMSLFGSFSCITELLFLKSIHFEGYKNDNLLQHCSNTLISKMLIVPEYK